MNYTITVILLLCIALSCVSLLYIVNNQYIVNDNRINYGYIQNQLQSFENPPCPSNVQEFSKVRYINPFSYFCLAKRNIYVISNNYPEIIQMFVTTVLPKIKHPFKVVICHGDFSVSKLWNEITQILAHNKLQNIYAVNTDVEHPKIIPIPIGIDTHTSTLNKRSIHSHKKNIF